MGLLDMLLGNSALDDQTIASDLLKDSKFAVIGLAQAATETANPQLRKLLGEQLVLTILQHHQLSDLLTAKDWYRPFLSPGQQLGAEMQLAEKLPQ